MAILKPRHDDGAALQLVGNIHAVAQHAEHRADHHPVRSVEEVRHLPVAQEALTTTRCLGALATELTVHRVGSQAAERVAMGLGARVAELTGHGSRVHAAAHAVSGRGTHVIVSHPIALAPSQRDDSPMASRSMTCGSSSRPLGAAATGLAARVHGGRGGDHAGSRPGFHVEVAERSSVLPSWPLGASTASSSESLPHATLEVLASSWPLATAKAAPASEAVSTWLQSSRALERSPPAWGALGA